MSRFLFVVPPLAGHVNPAAGVGHALEGRGHEVAWACAENFIRPLVGSDATVYRTGMRLYHPQGERGAAALKSLWEGFIVPFARFTLPAVEKAVQQYRPDVMVVDQHAVAGAIVAQRHGIPWASLATSSLELGRFLLARPGAARPGADQTVPARSFPELPKVDAWIRGHLDALCDGAGLSRHETFDPRFSPYLVLACTTAALTGAAAFPGHFALVGPMLAGRAAGPDFPWDRVDPGRRHVLVTMGTLAVDIAKDFHSLAMEALRPLGDRLQAIRVAPDGTLPGPPAPVLAAPRVPQLELMPHLDAVVCHGGMNTVCEALAHSVPLVIAPIRHDQPVTAAQVVAAGAGIRVRFGRVRAEQLRAAVTAVLDDPAYRDAARRVGSSFAAAGGGEEAANRLERLAAPETGPGNPREDRPHGGQRGRREYS